MVWSVPLTQCPCSKPRVQVDVPEVQLLSIATLPQPQSPRGVTVANPLQQPSPFAAGLGPIPRTLPSDSEAPRGPHPGTGHRNRTIFSPGQAEALEKGAGAGWMWATEVRTQRPVGHG